MGNLHTLLLTAAMPLSFVSRMCCVWESPFRRKGHLRCAFKAGCCGSDRLQQCPQFLHHLVSPGSQASSAPCAAAFPGNSLGWFYSRASLVAQLVKSAPAMWKTWVRSLGWEDPLEKGKATHSSILAWRVPWTT